MLNDRKLGSEWTDEEASKNQPAFIDENKLLFFVFSFAAVVTLIAALLFIWYLIYPRMIEIHFDKGINFIFSILILGVLSHFLVILVIALSEKKIINLNVRNRLIESYLFFYSERLGRLFGVSKDRIGNSFVKVNNSLVRAENLSKADKKRLLVLLPRCMQYMDCKQNVVEDISHCKECGRCNIKEFKQLGNRYGFYTHVATGGTLARKKIIDYRPTVILAVACERELVSGISDTSKAVPIIGLPNKRDEGPCKNTKADIEQVLKTLKFILGNDEEDKGNE